MGFLFLQALFWFGYRPVVGNLTSLKFSWLDDHGQREALRYFGLMDMGANWISAGGHWDYQNVGRKPHIVLEHYGRKSGMRHIAAAMPYNLADRHAAGVSGLIIAGSNQGFEKLPQWAINLRHMAAKGELLVYNFGRTVYYAEINEISDDAAREKLIPEMVKVYPSFGNYLKGCDLNLM
ncbi:MAG: nitroreductase family deazaflavin-dependent oxidoreductase [Gammaproteobacteria bacterium]|nr:nitroreductase family deazaflavin-dependent oxidoreductase [Gammaproteobacteria bacterium]